MHALRRVTCLAAGLAPVERQSIRQLPHNVLARNCALCLMPFRSSDVVVLACKHVFHKVWRCHVRFHSLTQRRTALRAQLRNVGQRRGA